MSEVKVMVSSPTPTDLPALETRSPEQAPISEALYREMYARSIQDPEGFWAEQAERFVSWFSPWNKVHECDFTQAQIRWYEGGKLNAS